MNTLEKNKKYSDSYHQEMCDKIPDMIVDILNKNEVVDVLDLGCGDGGIIKAIAKKYNKKIVGVDISPRRIDELKFSFPQYNFLCADASNTRINKQFDLIICTQVIEHVSEDRRLIQEIDRLLKPNGYLFITSVVKKCWAVYIYRNKGKFVLDPTHEREYKDEQEFLQLFKRYKLIKYNFFSVKRKKIFEFTIPGYYIIEALYRK